jgi:hypothetical protein
LLGLKKEVLLVHGASIINNIRQPATIVESAISTGSYLATSFFRKAGKEEWFSE